MISALRPASPPHPIFTPLLDFCGRAGIVISMEKWTEEWLRQSEYDMDAAVYMFQGGRYLYAVFMCHLAVEKALKGLYYEKLREIPPRSHSFVYLLNAIGIVPPEKPGKFITKLSEASIATRYPEDLAKVQQVYTEGVVKDILAGGKEAIAWIRAQLSP